MRGSTEVGTESLFERSRKVLSERSATTLPPPVGSPLSFCIIIANEMDPRVEGHLP